MTIMKRFYAVHFHMLLVFQMGMTFYPETNLTAAIHWFQLALEKSPGNSQVMMILAGAYARLVY